MSKGYGVNDMARGQVHYQPESDNKPNFGMEMTEKSMDRTPEILSMLERQDTLIHSLNDQFEQLYDKLGAVRAPESPQDPTAMDKEGGPKSFSPIAERLYHHNERLDQLVMAIRRTVDSVQL